MPHIHGAPGLDKNSLGRRKVTSIETKFPPCKIFKNDF